MRDSPRQQKSGILLDMALGRIFLFLSISVLAPFQEAGAARQEAVISQTYRGSHPETHAAFYDQVRLWVQQAPLEISSQLGLILYQSGFHYPMTIRFDDGAPAGV